jgi:molybdopterin converting factor small subunit
MKITLELFGASRDFSNKDYLEENFKGNESFKKIVENSAFCSEDNNIIKDDYKITKDQKIGIIPPIGGG